MKIIVGSTNFVKVEVVREVISSYGFLKGAEVIGVNVSSRVSAQPKSLEETLTGAMNRARYAFRDCDYSVGLEDGLMRVHWAKTGCMNVCVCDVFDGREHYLGLSSAFEYPLEVVRLVLKEGLDVNQAFHKIGLTDNPKIGSDEGAIGILSRGRLMRKEYSKQAITMALVRLENKELY